MGLIDWIVLSEIGGREPGFKDIGLVIVARYSRVYFTIKHKQSSYSPDH